jgi:regulator of sirC expression with transglutaminase-like and TPR domain
MILNPRDHETIADKATALFALGRFQEALTFTDASLAIAPSHKPAMKLKKQSLIRLGLHNEVIAWTSKMLSIDPNDHETMHDRGIAQMKMQKVHDTREPQGGLQAGPEGLRGRRGLRPNNRS